MSSEKEMIFLFPFVLYNKKHEAFYYNEVKLQVLNETFFFFNCSSMNNSRVRKTLNYISNKYNCSSEH